MVTLPLAYAPFTGMSPECGRFTGSLLWKISGNGLNTPSYIFGTHHFAEAAFALHYPGLGPALERCTQLVGELDIWQLKEHAREARTVLNRYMLLPEDVVYADLLPEDDLLKLDRGLQSVLGSGLDRLGSMKPSGIGMVLIPQKMYRECMPEFDLHQHVSMDQRLQEIARAQGKTVRGTGNSRRAIQRFV